MFEFNIWRYFHIYKTDHPITPQFLKIDGRNIQPNNGRQKKQFPREEVMLLKSLRNYPKMRLWGNLKSVDFTKEKWFHTMN